MILELMDVGRKPPSRFVTAQFVREVYVNRSLHGSEDATSGIAFQ
jgi:hypothetical protein